MPQPHLISLAAATTVLLLAAAAAPAVAQDVPASPAAPTPSLSGTVTVYTSVTQDTVDAVLSALAVSHPQLKVEVFRAPTGELDARLASEQRTGGIGADVLWMTDPLSLQRYEAEGLLAPLAGDAFEAVPPEHRGETFVGTRLLNLVIVAGDDLASVPATWADLTDAAYAGRVAIPDPGFAGSAFGALGYFGTSPDYGMDFYQALKDNGAVQVQSPVDVLTGVAEGNYDAGITLDKIARDAIEDGSPVTLVWPADGAIAVSSPAAVVAASDDLAAAQAFQAFLVSTEGQAAIAGTGWQPVRADVAWPATGDAVVPDWSEVFGEQAALLEDYYAIFGD